MAKKKKAEKSWGRRLLTAAWLLLFLSLAAAYGATYILPPLGPMPEHQKAAMKAGADAVDGDSGMAEQKPSAENSEQMASEGETDGEMTAEGKMAEESSSVASPAEQNVDTDSQVTEAPTKSAESETSQPEMTEPAKDPDMTPKQEDSSATLDRAPVKELKGGNSATENQTQATTTETQSTGKSDDGKDTSEMMAARPVPTAPTPTPAPEPEVDRRPPWQKFAQPFRLHPQKPKIAIVIYSLGLSKKATEQAVRQLPREVTLSFSPYARKLEGWVSLARARGHEAMIDLPLEPIGYPASDPGHFALLTSNSVAQNIQRLDDVTGSSSAFVGLTAFMGSRFSSSAASMEPVVKAIADRGLIYLDNGQVAETVTKSLAPNYGLAYLITDRVLDGKSANRLTIDARLAQLERLALTTGRAIGLARPFPVTIERLKVWAKKLEIRGIQLVPITQMVSLYDSPAEIKGAPDPDQTITRQSTDDLG